MPKKVAEKSPQLYVLEAGPDPASSEDPNYAVWEIAHHYASRYEIGNPNAQEIAHEIMDYVDARRKRDPGFLSQPSDLDKFVIVAVRNRVHNLWRRESRFVPIESVANQLGVRQDTTDGPENDRLEFIYAQADKLPEKCREVWYMRYRDDIKPQQIAAFLDLSVKTVDAQIRKGTLRIREACHQYNRKPLGDAS